MQKATGDRIVQIHVDGFDKEVKTLVPAQLKHIFELIEQVKAHGISEENVQDVLRRTLGVTAEEEILEEQYEEAVQCLRDQQDCAARHNKLISRLLNLPKTEKNKARVYSQKRFHTSHYKSLSIEQVQQVIDHVMQTTSPVKLVTTEEATKLLSDSNKNIDLPRKFNFHINMVCFVLGAICGSIITYILVR